MNAQEAKAKTLAARAQKKKLRKIQIRDYIEHTKKCIEEAASLGVCCTSLVNIPVDFFAPVRNYFEKLGYKISNRYLCWIEDEQPLARR